MRISLKNGSGRSGAPSERRTERYISCPPKINDNAFRPLHGPAANQLTVGRKHRRLAILPLFRPLHRQATNGIDPLWRDGAPAARMTPLLARIVFASAFHSPSFSRSRERAAQPLSPCAHGYPRTFAATRTLFRSLAAAFSVFDGSQSPSKPRGAQCRHGSRQNPCSRGFRPRARRAPVSRLDRARVGFGPRPDSQPKPRECSRRAVAGHGRLAGMPQTTSSRSLYRVQGSRALDGHAAGRSQLAFGHKPRGVFGRLSRDLPSMGVGAVFLPRAQRPVDVFFGQLQGRTNAARPGTETSRRSPGPQNH